MVDYVDDESGEHWRAELWPDCARDQAADLLIHADGAEAMVESGIRELEEQ